MAYYTPQTRHLKGNDMGSLPWISKIIECCKAIFEALADPDSFEKWQREQEQKCQ